DKQPVWTFVDREGRYGPVYNEQIYLFGPLTKVKQDEKIALLRPDGTMAAPYIFSRIDDAAEGFTPAQIAGF
ncbi:MAG: SatD family protein, partial [Muribaculaceae bacterium]|nr:SatD family protein [Muribaculaceae bacterium]